MNFYQVKPPTTSVRQRLNRLDPPVQRTTLTDTDSLCESPPLTELSNDSYRRIYVNVYSRWHIIPASLDIQARRRMYDTLRRDFYWPNMANDVATVVRNCTSCAKVRGVKHSHQHFLKLFPAAGPLEYVAIDILGPLPKSAKGNQYILVITDRYIKLARAIPLATTTASVVAETFLDHWVYPYGMPNYLLTDNGTQFVSKFFETISSCHGIKHLTKTAYHLECNGQAEQYSRILV